MDYKTIRSYFEQLNAHLADRGLDSLDNVRDTVARIEARRLIYFMALAALGIGVASAMTVYGLPVLMMWMVLVLFGAVLSTLGSLRRRRQRERIAATLRDWEAEHPLQPLAQAVYAGVEWTDIPLNVQWLLQNRRNTVFDWTHNYAGALADVRQAVEVPYGDAELAG